MAALQAADLAILWLTGTNCFGASCVILFL
ncbi:hypothetical protein CCACVL1_25432 [Corchorus capsularis]|uniref:Uncharacterized protein n=1 Tax=Corchorus capsularis TaxID=210143 RepID=A0A1R3GKH7_COCAP|nr:hypothetical protein CCACVL1_25432 [Corchorus capsularis]